MTDAFDTRKTQAADWFRSLRDTITAAFEALEDSTDSDLPVDMLAQINEEFSPEAISGPRYSPAAQSTVTTERFGFELEDER